MESDISWQLRPPSFSFSSYWDSEHSGDSDCGGGERVREEVGRRAGTNLTCFTRTKVQILTEVGGSGMGCG